MDARELLESVGRRYAGLRTLAVEILSVTETASEHSEQRSTRRGKACFAVPNKVRIEEGGQRNTCTVCDGIDVQHYFGPPNRYVKRPVNSGRLPGAFVPEVPFPGTAFLFSRVAEQVATADIAGQESIEGEGSAIPCVVVSVTYESPKQGEFPVSMPASPIKYWVDPVSRLIRRSEGSLTHRHPRDSQPQMTTHVSTFTRMVVDEPIPPETFECTPPPDAIDDSHLHMYGRRGGGGGVTGYAMSGGRRSYNAGESAWADQSHMNGWDGESWIDVCRVKLSGVDLIFERRLTLSEDRRQLSVRERITGPQGETTREFTIPVA